MKWIDMELYTAEVHAFYLISHLIDKFFFCVQIKPPLFLLSFYLKPYEVYTEKKLVNLNLTPNSKIQ